LKKLEEKPLSSHDSVNAVQCVVLIGSMLRRNSQWWWWKRWPCI